MTNEKRCGISADKLRIAADSPLQDVITQVKYDALDGFSIILIELLSQQGFSFDELLVGLSGYAHHLGLEDVQKLLEEASVKYSIETKKRQ